jgi:hypothetical protein
MAKHWVLDTETKGTGAEMVPLEKVLERRRSSRAVEDEQPRRRSRPRRREPPAPEPQPRRPRRFKVVDVMTRQPLAEDVGIREALEVLADARSVVDVIVYAWDREREDWRPLAMREQKLLWERR